MAGLTREVPGEQTPIAPVVETPVEGGQAPIVDTQSEAPPEKYGLSDFGDFSSVDDLKEALAYKQKYSELETGFATKEQSYQQQLKEAAVAPKYKNEQLFKLSQIEDDAKANAMLSIVMNNASDKETYIQHLMLSKRAETREDAITKFENKFPDLTDPDIDPTESRYRRDAANLNDAADDIRNELKQEFEGIELPKKEEPVSREEIETSWQPFFGNIAQVDELSWEIEGGDPVNIKLTPEEQEMFKQASADYIYNNNFGGSAEAATQLMGMLKQSYLEKNFKKIANSLITRGMEARDSGKIPEGAQMVNSQPGSTSGYKITREI